MSIFNSDLRKFIQHILVWLALLAIIVLVFNTVYKSGFYINSNTYDLEEEKFWNVPSDINICNLGTSHSQEAFCYEDMTGVTAFNFALPSQSLSYDLRILEQFQDSLSADANVIIVLSPFSFFGIPEDERDYFESMNKRYYKFLDKDLIKDYDTRTAVVYKYLPLLASEWVENSIDNTWDTLFPSPYVRAYATTDAEKASADGVRKYEDYVEDRKDEYGIRIFNEEEIDALDSILSLCRDKGWNAYLVTTPFLSEYTDTVAREDPEFHQDFMSVINATMDEYGVKYYDYSLDERFNRNYSYFWDSVHMNKNGAIKFTDTVMREVLSN